MAEESQGRGEPEELPERQQRAHRTPGASPTEPLPRRRSSSWFWVPLLLLLVAALAWYALSRGEPQPIDLPEIETPEIDLPEETPDVDVNVGGAESTEG